MNDTMHVLLNKLRVIGKIKENQKLDTSNGINVYVDGWINWFFRKWNRDNKDEGIRNLRDLYKAFQQSVETVINESKHSNTESKKSMAIYVLINAATELKNSVRGLENLTKTYAAYPTTTAEIDGILKDYVIVTYSSLMDSIPKDKLTKDLRESITFCGVVVYNGIDGLRVPLVSNNLVNRGKPDDADADNADNEDIEFAPSHSVG
jgi:hypothetical protein